MVPAGTQARECRQDSSGSGYVRDVAHETRNGLTGVVAGGIEQVAHVHEADDVVDGGVGDGVAGVGQVADALHGLSHRDAVIQSHDLGSRPHDLAHLPAT